MREGIGRRDLVADACIWNSASFGNVIDRKEESGKRYSRIEL